MGHGKIRETVNEVELDAAYAVLRGLAPREWVRKALQAAYDTFESPNPDNMVCDLKGHSGCESKNDWVIHHFENAEKRLGRR